MENSGNQDINTILNIIKQIESANLNSIKDNNDQQNQNKIVMIQQILEYYYNLKDEQKIEFFKNIIQNNECKKNMLYLLKNYDIDKSILYKAKYKQNVFFSFIFFFIQQIKNGENELNEKIKVDLLSTLCLQRTKISSQQKVDNFNVFLELFDNNFLEKYINDIIPYLGSQIYKNSQCDLIIKKILKNTQIHDNNQIQKKTKKRLSYYLNKIDPDNLNDLLNDDDVSNNLHEIFNNIIQTTVVFLIG